MSWKLPLRISEAAWHATRSCDRLADGVNYGDHDGHIKDVYVNDPMIARVIPLACHDDHFHITIKD